MGTKKKQGILAAITSILLVAVVVLGVVVNDAESKFITIEDLLTPLAGGPVLVQQTDADINVIPDKYNTGCKGELTKVTGPMTINGILFKNSGGITVLDFYYSNKDVVGDVVIENMDFSEGGFSVNSEAKVSGKKINVIFNNCKFANAKNAYPASDVFTYTFNNCTIEQFQGSNATFNDCQFGHSYKDGLNPYQNIHLNRCFFAEFASTDPAGAGKHSDGSQIYAHKDTMAKNISFSRCRFEVPAVQTTGNTAAVNSCVSVALEYNDADDISVCDCIANGGGYTFYASKKYDTITLTNIVFNNIKVGSAKLFGTFYPKIADGVTTSNVVDQDSLYVSSVWKENGETHIIVSNDTNIERTLKVVTNSKEYTYSIKACLGGNDLRYDNYDMPYSDFPFDIDIVVPEDASYVICYDASDGSESQIRFVNWSGEQVYVGGVIKDDTPEEKNKPNKKNKNDKKTSRNDAKKPVLITENEVEDITPAEIEETVVDDNGPVSGTCGSEVTYLLTTDGTMIISGNGPMNNYDSSKPAPWSERMSSINKLVIEEGVTTIGGQSFRRATNLLEVVLPDSVVEIKGNAFQGCSALKGIEIGKNVVAIGRYAFSGTGLSSVVYQGSEEEWKAVSVGDNNDQLTQNITFAFVEEIQTEQENDVESCLMEGTCGPNATFTLKSNGELIISGTGDMKTFDSSKPAPWSERMEEITKVVIEEGITSVGGQSFRKAVNLSEVIIADSVTDIKGNSFQGCSSLCNVTISKNVTAIGRYAFSGTGLSFAMYEGSSEDFANISIGDHNEPFVNNLSFAE